MAERERLHVEVLVPPAESGNGVLARVVPPATQICAGEAAQVGKAGSSVSIAAPFGPRHQHQIGKPELEPVTGGETRTWIMSEEKEVDKRENG